MLARPLSATWLHEPLLSDRTDVVLQRHLTARSAAVNI
jgi:hypothetical protein